MKVRSAIVAAEKDCLKCAVADEKERGSVIGIIKNSVGDQDSEAAFSLVSSAIPLIEGSSLAYLHSPVSKMANELVGLDVFEKQRSHPVAYYRVCTTPEGQLEAVSPLHSFNLTQGLAFDAVLSDRAASLFEVVKELGGEVNLAPLVSVDQWLNFHAIKIPSTIGQARDLLSFLEWDWPETDNLGNYWEQLSGNAGKAPGLTLAQYADIRTVTAQRVSNGQGLLETLYQQLKGTLPKYIGWENANEVLATLLSSGIAKTIAKSFIDRLEWYGAQEGESVHDDDLAQMIATAIILDLDPSLGENARNHVGSFDIYAPSAAADQSPEIVRDALERYLLKRGNISYDVCPLASQLLLAHLAPELLVKKLPRTLAVGSVGWVTFSQAVALIEVSSKGATRFMTYEQVMNFANIGSISSNLEKLQGIAAIDCIIDWALINEVVNHKELSDTSTDASQRALAAYDVFVRELVSAGKVFSTPMPTRKEIALTQLRKAVPGCDFLEKQILRHQTDRLTQSYKMSILDLHMEGDLTTQEWDWREETYLYDSYPELKWLTPVLPVFLAQIAQYHRDLVGAVSTNIRLALSTMPQQHRNLFCSHKVVFFTVRSFVGKENESASGPAGAGSGKATFETQEDRDEAKGRFGIILYIALGEDDFLCYELFFLTGKCRINRQLGALIFQGRLCGWDSRVDFNRGMKDLLRVVQPSNYPLDFKAYRNGTESVAGVISREVIEKLGELPAPSEVSTVSISGYQYFASPRFIEIAKFIVTHHPIATAGELVEAGMMPTEREIGQEKLKKYKEHIVNLVVPFKKCVEDIWSGEGDKVREGVWGCLLDALGIITAVLGVPTKVLAITSKMATLAAKIARLAKVGLRLAVAVFNPVDGLPTAAYRGTKFVFKGAMRLGHDGVKLVEAATFQLHRISGKSRNFNLSRTAKGTSLGYGSWRPRADSLEILEVCAIRQNKHWYSVNRQGRAWGKRLINFNLTRLRLLPRLQKVMPTAFARQILQRSLPAATRKVDNALKILTAPGFSREAELIMTLFFTGSGKANQKLETMLQLLKLDISNLVTANFVLGNASSSANILQMTHSQYLAWKRIGGKNDVLFLNVDTQNLVERFASAQSNYGEVADDLLHEMLQAQLTKDEAASALTGVAGQPGVDVAPLLNLATGRLPRSEDEPEVFFDARRATSNADSFAVATALLSQLHTHEALARKNLYIMSEAIAAYAGRTIDAEVVINLNLNTVEAPIIDL